MLTPVVKRYDDRRRGQKADANWQNQTFNPRLLFTSNRILAGKCELHLDEVIAVLQVDDNGYVQVLISSG